VCVSVRACVKFNRGEILLNLVSRVFIFLYKLYKVLYLIHEPNISHIVTKTCYTISVEKIIKRDYVKQLSLYTKII